MYILGIESTAHTFGVGITDGNRILSNERDTFMPKKGGIVPREAAKHHYRKAPEIIKSALESAGISLQQVDMFAVSQGPGILSCLKAGVSVGVFLSRKYKKPIIGVNHCIGHIEIGRLMTGFNDPVILYVSGGNTQIITYLNKRYAVFGETQDIGVGNLLDRVGRMLGIPFPAGPEIERLSNGGREYIRFPYTIKGMDVSFSGIETYVKNIIGIKRREDVCFSLQETVFSMLIEASERAMAYCGKTSLIITGGVAANSRLNEMGKRMCAQRGAEFRALDKEYTGDNGAMIAYTGYLMMNEGKTEIRPRPRFRTDVVEINYR
ncbi:tRNA (adenosine(37)-N6)-threonylcarbamoyltransferase complex transferase subunit TsaD [Candidatus Parvarchaeota archaeon]|nr:tRNA (adenosine(37)-N6)-threonylcarbamoyltransferase complex transferase subunit TsaD [Candidatus Parvarchaeota archaeon]